MAKALAAMNITGNDVDRLARESGKSPTILRRRLSRIDAIFQSGLHEYIQAFLGENGRLGQAIHEQYLS